MSIGTIYCVDIHIANGKITRFYHRVSAGMNTRFGVILPGPEHKFIRLPSTRQCYLSYLKSNKPYVYQGLMKYEKR